MEHCVGGAEATCGLSVNLSRNNQQLIERFNIINVVYKTPK